MFKVKRIEIPAGITATGSHYYIKPWPFQKVTAAITLNNLVLHRDIDPPEGLIVHEEHHITQIKNKGGWLKFYASYLVEYFKHGYRDNRHEIEARKEADEHYRK